MGKVDGKLISENFPQIRFLFSLNLTKSLEDWIYFIVEQADTPTSAFMDCVNVALAQINRRKLKPVSLLF